MELAKIESQGVFGPGIVAASTFDSTGKPPTLGRRQRCFLARGIHQFGIRLLIVPCVRVTPPRAAIEVEELRFDTAPACRVSELFMAIRIRH